MFIIYIHVRTCMGETGPMGSAGLSSIVIINLINKQLILNNVAAFQLSDLYVVSDQYPNCKQLKLIIVAD